jgi:hypothetical protein
MMGGVRKFVTLGQSQEVWLSLIAEEIKMGEVFGL